MKKSNIIISNFRECGEFTFENVPEELTEKVYNLIFDEMLKARSEHSEDKR